MTALLSTPTVRDVDGGEPVDVGLWLAGRWLGDRRRAPLGVPRVAYPPTHLPRTGAGVRVALLDGVVDAAHPDLRGARVWDRGRTRVPAVAATAEGSARATAHASLLVGQGERDVLGLVPDADLLVVPVLTVGGFTSDELLVRAVRRVVADGAQVLVLPFGRRRLGRRVAMVLRTVAESGVRVVVAAGDLGPDVLAFPASVSGVTAVTAHDDAGLLPGCSARGDLSAPGSDVPAAGRDGVVRLRGSSPAAVLAAGVVAAVLGEVHRERREAGERDRLVDA
ncbi:S8 family serine peptidase [Actinotalea solisilvae]|uniref:S8 family serine peptidase n=1 Tax=Actinotalea solisilvae TaxID=2072922 RepID=UPI0018F1089D|nr:S8 family serine peptidase [Actinotalea solisilvae]